MLDLVLNNVSYFGIIAVLLATGAGLPIPEELVVVAAAWASYEAGPLNPWLAFLSCLAGALAGDCLMYAVGYYFGHSILRENRWVGRWVHPEREARVERLIARHGLKVLFAARFVMGLRSTVYLAAGVLRIPFRRFVLVDVLCATTVIGVVFGASYAFAPRLESLYQLWDLVRGTQVWVTGLVALSILAVVVYYWRRARLRKARIAMRRQERASRQQMLVANQRTAIEQSEPSETAA
ncbi:MAG: DedA family protein [Pirellulales bacterium]|nr:DedA family protein [Pirellulales bacterium]